MRSKLSITLLLVLLIIRVLLLYHDNAKHTSINHMANKFLAMMGNKSPVASHTDRAARLAT